VVCIGDRSLVSCFLTEEVALIAIGEEILVPARLVCRCSDFRVALRMPPGTKVAGGITPPDGRALLVMAVSDSYSPSSSWSGSDNTALLSGPTLLLEELMAAFWSCPMGVASRGLNRARFFEKTTILAY
jgi:hypothetical protein